MIISRRKRATLHWESNNKNDIAKEIERGKAEGRYKDCAHLAIGDDDFNSLLGGGRFYVNCLQDSLNWPDEVVVVPTLPGSRPHSRPQCPHDCFFYRPTPAAMQGAPPSPAGKSVRAKVNSKAGEGQPVQARISITDSQVFLGSVSNSNVNSPGAQIVSQLGAFRQVLGELRRAVEAVKEETVTKADALVDIDTAEAQLKRSKPDVGILRALLSSLRNIG